MKYLRITNVGGFPRVYLETIGLSTKRDGGEPKIGLFGTGSKFAAVAALRLGIATSVTSSDDQGRYYVHIGSEPLPGLKGRTAERLTYEYLRLDGNRAVRGDTNRSSLALEACLSWNETLGDDPVKELRFLKEHVANAYDEDSRFEMTQCATRTFAPKGKTSVYLTLTDGIRHVLKHPGRYFKFLLKQGPRRIIPGRGEIWRKSEFGMTRLFVRGVISYCSRDKAKKSLFDYSLFDNTLLSEERVLKEHLAYMSGVGRMWCRETDLGMAKYVLNEVAHGYAPYEEEALGFADADWFTPESAANWRAAACEVFGPKPAVSCGNPGMDDDARQLYGYDVAAPRDDIKRFLMALGFPTTDKVAPDLKKSVRWITFAELPAESQADFLEAFRMFSRRYTERAHIPVIFGVPLTEAAAQAGFALNYDRIAVMTRLDGTLPGVDDLYKTLQHESGHCVSKAHDSDRRFRNLADHDLLVDRLRSEGYPNLDDGTPVPQLAAPVLPTYGEPPVPISSLSQAERLEIDDTLEQLRPTLPDLTKIE
ncbi:MAG: hypothetical protein RLZZ324_1303 [Candidatus Parcubacteria bacterium]